MLRATLRRGVLRRCGAPRARVLVSRVPRRELCSGRGAIPGLSSATLAQHATSLGGNAVKCGLRLILKSYELDVVATSMEEARAWVRGVNHLPLGGKHRILIELMRQNAISGEDDEDD